MHSSAMALTLVAGLVVAGCSAAATPAPPTVAATAVPTAAATAVPQTTPSPSLSFTTEEATACDRPSGWVNPNGGFSSFRDPSESFGNYTVAGSRAWMVTMVGSALADVASEGDALVPAAIDQADWNKAVAALKQAATEFAQPMTPSEYTAAVDQLAQATAVVGNQCLQIRIWVQQNVPQ